MKVTESQVPDQATNYDSQTNSSRPQTQVTNISIEPEVKKSATSEQPMPTGYDSQNEEQDKEQKLNDTINLF